MEKKNITESIRSNARLFSTQPPREKERIAQITELMQQIWEQHPNLRYFQLYDYLQRDFKRTMGLPDDLFYVEDTVWLAYLSNYPLLKQEKGEKTHD